MSTEKSPTDAQIEADVRAVLYGDVRINTDAVDVRAEQGVVYLTGTVPSLTEKAYARYLADRVKGVRRVVNELRVVPLRPRTDIDITADVVAALTKDSLVDEDKIEVTTVDGVVYLRGTVGSYTERKAADADARSIGGVVDVINELIVLPEYARPDEAIAADVKLAIEQNLRVDPGAVAVAIRHGIARLTGTVKSVEQRWLADELARWTPGVLDVENALTVETLER